MNCAAAVGNINLPTQLQKGAAAHPKGSVLFRCILLLIIRAQPIKPRHNYSHFALIYSNAVSYPRGNYEQFFFTWRVFFGVDKRDSAPKEMCCSLKKKTKSKIEKQVSCCCCLFFFFRLSLCIRQANCLQVYITGLSMHQNQQSTKQE